MSTTNTATLTLLDGMSFAARTGSGHTLTLDAKQAVGGQERGPRPMELLLLGLGGCTAMDVISILLKKRQVVTSYAVEVVGEQREDYPRIFPRMTVTHVLEGTALDERAVRRAIFLSATKYCPVSATIAAGPTELHHRYRIVASTGADGDGREAQGEVIITGPYRSVEPVA